MKFVLLRAFLYKHVVYPLIRLIGYENVIQLKDSILFLAGIFLGGLVMAVLSGRSLFRLQKDDNLGKISLVRFVKSGRKYVLANPNTTGEAIESLLLSIFRPMFTKKSYTIRDEQRTKRFLIFLSLIGFALCVLAFFLINHTILL